MFASRNTEQLPFSLDRQIVESVELWAESSDGRRSNPLFKYRGVEVGIYPNSSLLHSRLKERKVMGVVDECVCMGRKKKGGGV